MKKLKFKLTRGKITGAIIVLALILVAMGLGALVRILQNQQNQNTPQTVSGLPEAIDEIQNLSAQGKTNEANAKADDVINNPSSGDDVKYQAYMQKGNTRANNNDLKGAIAEYEKALAIREDFEVTFAIAEIYERDLNYPKAIEFFKKAKDLVPDNDVRRDSEKAAIQMRIDHLEDQL